MLQVLLAAAVCNKSGKGKVSFRIFGDSVSALFG